MAVAASLIPGFKYEIERGILCGTVVTIVDNRVFPESDPELRRKITVRYEDGSIDYMLPRHINGTPVGIDGPALTGTADPTPVQVNVIEHDTAIERVQMDELLASHAVNPIVDPMDDRLDHLRPNKAKVKMLKGYINRVMANGMTDVEMLLTLTNDDYRAKNGGHPASFMLKGDTQSGKTMLVEVLAVKWAEAMGLPKPMPIFTLSGSSGVTDFDMFGQPTANPAKGEDESELVWLHGVVDLAARAGGILYLDEINAMGERVTSSLHPLVDMRHYFENRNKPVLRGGLYMPEHVLAHEDLWIIGTFNEGYRGMGDMNEAFLNRFRIIRWDYDEKVERKLITSPAVYHLGESLRTARKANTKGIRTPVGTSALQKLEMDILTFGIEVGLEWFKGMFKAAETDVVEEIIQGRSIMVLLQEEQAQREADALAADDISQTSF